MTYHAFISEETMDAYGSFTVEFIACDPYLDAGWYWSACWPGCLPDGDPQGPFETYELAFSNASAAGAA